MTGHEWTTELASSAGWRPSKAVATARGIAGE